MTDDRSTEIQTLYHEAFRNFGSVALWNMRPVEEPTPADALAITAALRTHGRMDAWTGDGSPSGLRRSAVPITEFQSAVLRLLAAERSPDSYVAGGVAINRAGPRISADIDIFHDSVARLESAVRADEAALIGGGYKLTWPPQQRTGKHAATFEKQGEQMQLEWVADFAFRFFPTQPDALFGYVLIRSILQSTRPRQLRTAAHHAMLAIWSPSTKPFCRAKPRSRRWSARFPVRRPRKRWPRSHGTAISRPRNFRCWRPSNRSTCPVCTAAFAA